MQTSFPPFIWRVAAPEDMGGMGDIDAKLSEAGIEAGTDEQDEIISSVSFPFAPFNVYVSCEFDDVYRSANKQKERSRRSQVFRPCMITSFSPMP